MTAQRADKARAVEAYLAGATAAEVAAVYGVDAKTVGRWVHKSGHKMRPPARRPKPLPDEAVQAVAMYVAGAPASEVADRFGVHLSTVLSWVRKKGLQPRSRQQPVGASGHRGVHFHRPTGTWRALSPKRNGCTLSLGYYPTAEDAARAVDYYRLTNDLGPVNFPDSTDETLAQAERWAMRKNPPKGTRRKAVLDALSYEGMTVAEVHAKVAHLGCTPSGVYQMLRSCARTGDAVQLDGGVYARAGAPEEKKP